MKCVFVGFTTTTTSTATSTATTLLALLLALVPLAPPPLTTDAPRLRELLLAMVHEATAPCSHGRRCNDITEPLRHRHDMQLVEDKA